MKTPIITTILTTVALVVSSACASPAQTIPTAAPAPTVAPAPAAAPAPTVAPAPAAAPAPTVAPAPTAAPALTTPAQAPAPAATPKPMAPAPVGAGNANLKFSNLKLTPATVKVGEVVTVTVNVTNPDADNNYTISLKVNGKVVEEQSTVCKIDLPCEETKEAVFKIKMAAPGTYTVEVGGQSGTLVVQ